MKLDLWWTLSTRKRHMIADLLKFAYLRKKPCDAAALIATGGNIVTFGAPSESASQNQKICNWLFVKPQESRETISYICRNNRLWLGTAKERLTKLSELLFTIGHRQPVYPFGNLNGHAITNTYSRCFSWMALGQRVYLVLQISEARSWNPVNKQMDLEIIHTHKSTTIFRTIAARISNYTHYHMHEESRIMKLDISLWKNYPVLSRTNSEQHQTNRHGRNLMQHYFSSGGYIDYLLKWVDNSLFL